MLLIEIYKSKK